MRHHPRAAGYNMRLWTTKLVRHCISTRGESEYGRERVRQGLHAVGCRLRRLRYWPLKAAPQEHAACVRTRHEPRKVLPEEHEVRFVDEAPVRRHPLVTAHGGLADAIPEVPTG